MRDDYDVIVVGARIAGSTLAALLGDAGVPVLLLDRARFPSTTLSTHYFRGAGMVGVLQRLGILDEVLALGSPPLVREHVYAGRSAERTDGPAQNPGDAGYCLSVRREPLDAILLARARRPASVDVAEGTPVADLVRDGGRVAGVRLVDCREVRARFVVGADGRNSLVAKQVGAAAEEDAPAYRAVYYRYVDGFLGPDGAAPDGVELSLLGDEIAYVFPSDAGLTCVALSVNLETFRRLRREPQRRFAEQLATHPAVAARVAAARPDGRLWACGPERSWVRVPWGDGWALVGDAGLHQDPWSGLGIDLASVHATFLADALLDALGGTDEREALARYHARRNQHGLGPYRETTRGAADVSLVEEAPGLDAQ